jgi:hypothetical protein
MTSVIPGRRLGREDFEADRHAARYLREFDLHPEAMRRLVDLLNEPDSVRHLQEAELRHGMPALAGVIGEIEGDPAIEAVLRSGPDGYRFRQTVGVAVKLKMGRLGWRATGRKGSVRRARYFTKAEHYEVQPAVASDVRFRGLAALDAVARIGDEDERADTGRELLDALAESRAAEGRAF